jgi:molybdenum-dependent DNA-binding transcriptional regulator ModE
VALLQPTAPTAFDWAIYADATFAGLSVLAPVPFVDSAFEWYFRRRMPGAIARRRRRPLAPVVAYEMARGERGCVETCLLLPVTLTWELLKRLSAKLLYFITVMQATDQLSYYWHRAYLLDTMLLAGHLDGLWSAQVARSAMGQVLRNTRTSPLAQVARQVAQSPRHILRSLRRARQGQEDEVIAEKRSVMARAWSDLGGYLTELGERYLQTYAALAAARQAAEAAQAAESAGPEERGGKGRSA